MGRSTVSRAMRATPHSEVCGHRFFAVVSARRSQAVRLTLATFRTRPVKRTFVRSMAAYLTEAFVEPLPANGPTGFPHAGNNARSMAGGLRPGPFLRLKFESSRVANLLQHSPPNRQSLPSKALRPAGIPVANRESQNEKTRCNRDAAKRFRQQQQSS
jgi:hypothetical protein